MNELYSEQREPNIYYTLVMPHGVVLEVPKTFPHKHFTFYNIFYYDGWSVGYGIFPAPKSKTQKRKLKIIFQMYGSFTFNIQFQSYTVTNM